MEWKRISRKSRTSYTLQQPLFLIDTESEKRFKEFHAKNPRVYSQLVKLARQAKATGKHKMSIELLVNAVRWLSFLETEDTNSDFKINNNYKSHYARLIMEQEPDLSNIFNTREQRTS